MFTCEICKKVVPANTKSQRITLATRPRQYPARLKANKLGKNQYSNDPGGEGYETAREIIACPECAAQFEANGKHS